MVCDKCSTVMKKEHESHLCTRCRRHYNRCQCGGLKAIQSPICKKCRYPQDKTCLRCGVPVFGSLCDYCSKANDLCQCGKVKQRKAALCPACRPARQSHVCSSCGKKIPKRSKQCRDCIGWHTWTDEEDAFLLSHYAEHGSVFCAEHLQLPTAKVMERASGLGIKLTTSTYRRLVHDVASKKNKGAKATPEQIEASRQRALSDPGNYAKLMKGRLTCQQNKISKPEKKVHAILDELGISYESQAVINDKFICDIKINNLIIEIDGEWWHGHPKFEPLRPQQIAQKKKDSSKTAYLATCGYKVVRIWASDISIETIKTILQVNCV